ncbi:MAG: hypothetical protein KGI25_08080 [Thaumarchaeota archaeon]|nr:hypothetical protein [Nitrososphaerota archaeon]
MNDVSIAENAKINGIGIAIGSIFGGSLMLWFDWNLMMPINQFKNDLLTTIGAPAVIVPLLILITIAVIKLRK